MSVITKDLGVATAYGYAKSKGYTGTEEEFAELMASYADVAQQAEAAAQDAEDAKDAAVSAKNDAVTAKTAAESAQTAAAGSAQTASTKATEASNSAQTAAGSATAAGNSATAAAGSATTAQTAAQTATTKASEASSSASAASTAKTGAETARTGAQTAQTAAESAQTAAETAAASVSASAAQIEQNTEDITGLKNDFNQFPNGTYPNMSVGNANQLTATVGIEDNAPYLFRTSGGSNDIGDREDVRKIVGGTVAWNQIAKAINTDNWGKTGAVGSFSIENGEAICSGLTDAWGGIISKYSYQSTVGHKILISVVARCLNANESVTLGTSIVSGGNNIGTVSSASKTTIATILDTSVAKNGYIIIANRNNTNGFAVSNVQITDVTQDFGTAIADYVYSLEIATAGAGVAWLKKYFPKQFDAGYQAYDAGSLQSVSGLTMHRMIGFNQWNEQWEVGTISSGVPSFASNAIRSKNFCRCVAGATYYMTCGKTDGGSNNRYYLGIFWYDADKNMVSREYNNNGTVVAPDNAVYFKITTNTSTVIYGATYNHDICINLSWDGERDGEYEPYVEYTYPLDDSLTLRGIPKVDASGNLYYDGDEYLPDGTVNRRFGIVDLGTLTYSHSDLEHRYYTTDLSTVIKKVEGGLNLLCPGFIAVSSLSTIIEGNNGLMWLSGAGNISFSDNGVTTLSTFINSMSGVYLVYELATPTTDTAEPYQNPQIVDDFGTEEFILADGAFPVPVGHETYYKSNLRAKLEMAPDSPDGDGLYVVQQTSGQNEYVPLASTATIQDILTRLTALENENA